MADDFDRILDECIDRVNHGDSPSACLGDYPQYAEQLEPLLSTMGQARESYSFVTSASAKSLARQRFNTALERAEDRRQEKPTLFTRLFVRPVAWATLATVIVIAVLAGYFGLRPVVFPVTPPLYPVTPVPSPQGNFVFLISDEVNAIGDFESLTVSISKIGLLLSDDSEQRVEVAPEVTEVDLTLLPGDKTQEIWRGNVPEGHYSKVFIYVAGVRGILKETGQAVDVKLPSEKLQLSKPFQVTDGEVSSFTYDLTVVATGNPRSGVKYILKPQVGQSSVEYKPNPGDDKRGGKKR